MPVRAKRNRRRAEAVTALGQLFATGVDWDQEARAIGVETSAYDFPVDIEYVKRLWHQHGAAFLATYEDPHLTPWALEEFGAPLCQ